MGFVIITGRTLLWSLVSLMATLLMLVALNSPAWLVGLPKSDTINGETKLFSPSVGLSTKCSKPSSRVETAFSCSSLDVHGFSTDSLVYPNQWKASTFFIALGISIMSLTVFCGLIGWCYQSICRKSVFVMSGAAQTIAGMCYIIALTLYPMAWGAARVLVLCGKESSAFYPGDCSIGLGLWLAVVGTALTFLAACLSIQAEKSTSSDRVQDQIYEGHTLICLL